LQPSNFDQPSSEAVQTSTPVKPAHAKWLRIFIKTQRLAMALPLVGEFSRGIWLALAACALAGAILGGILARAPDIYAESAPKGFWNWLTTPIEFHPEMQLANFDDLDLQAVAVATDSSGRERLFVTGENALVAFSDDRGRNWTRVYYDPLMGGFAVQGKRAPFPVTYSTTSPTAGSGATQSSSSTTPLSKSPAGKSGGAPTQKSTTASPRQSPSQRQINPAPSFKKPAAKKSAAHFSWPSLVPSVLAAENPPAGTSPAGGGATSAFGASTTGSPLTLQPAPQGIPAICHRADGSLVLLLTGPRMREVVSTDFGETWGINYAAQLLGPPLPSISLEEFLAGKINLGGSPPNRLLTGTGRTGSIIGDIYLNLYLVGSSLISPHSVFLSADGQAWAVTDRPAGESIPASPASGFVYRSVQRDGNWTESFRTPGIELNDIVFTADGAMGFVVGKHGGIWRWRKSDGLWLPITRGALHPGQAPSGTSLAGSYWRLPPPWTYPLLFLALGWFLIAVAISAVPGANNLREVSAWVDSPSTPVDPTASVARISVSDRPLGENDVDHLGFRSIARGVAGFLRNPKTQLPVTLAINGNWGTGKSSLMNLICGELRRARFRPVWFNAWHHQEDENLLASLLQSVRQDAAPPVLSKGGLAFRLRLGWFRFSRYYPRAMAMVAVFIGLWAAESWYDAPDKNNAPQLRQYFQELGEKLQPPTSTQTPAGTQEAQNTPTQTSPGPAGNANAGNPASGPANGAGSQPPSGEKPGAPAKPNNSAPAQTPLLVTLLQLLAAFHEFLDGASSTVGTKPLAALYFLVRIFPSALGRLKAFQSEPASLLHTAAPGVSKQQIEAQTSFRMRFAKEFSDVTQALGENHRLVIFVDDLDRCRPGKVAEIMEAINYVTVSGDCAFILGIETHVVRAALGLSFNAMAQELEPQKNSSAGAPAPSIQDDTPEGKREKRKEFALAYVEKLINIEMNVPDLDLRKKQAFFVVDESSPALPDHFERARQIAKFGRWLGPAAAFLLVLALGWSAGRGIVRFAEWRAEVYYREQGKKEIATAKQKADAQAQSPSAAAAGQNQQPLPAPVLATETKPEQVPVVLSGEEPWPAVFFRSPVSWALVLFAVFWVAQLLTREPVPPAKDSENFARALAAWGWVAGAGLATPRATKRFLNRLRFLAMRQHPPSVQLPGLMKIMMTAEEQKRALELEQKASGDASTSAIPDDILVALAALEAYDEGRSLAAPEIVKTMNEVVTKAADSASKGDPHVAPFLAELARTVAPASPTLPAKEDEKRIRDLLAAQIKAGTLGATAMGWGQSCATNMSSYVPAYLELRGSVAFT
jgi:hypothetical protein